MCATTSALLFNSKYREKRIESRKFSSMNPHPLSMCVFAHRSPILCKIWEIQHLNGLLYQNTWRWNSSNKHFQWFTICRSNNKFRGTNSTFISILVSVSRNSVYTPIHNMDAKRNKKMPYKHQTTTRNIYITDDIKVFLLVASTNMRRTARYNTA